MGAGSAEAKSIVIRQKMKSAFAKVVLAARARGTAKEKAQQALAALSEFGWIDGMDRRALAPVASTPVVVQHGPDRTALVAFTLTRLSPASVRAAVTGMPQVIVVPDADMAEVFRAALAQSAKDRPSDRLIQIVLATH